LGFVKKNRTQSVPPNPPAKPAGDITAGGPPKPPTITAGGPPAKPAGDITAGGPPKPPTITAGGPPAKPAGDITAVGQVTTQPKLQLIIRKQSSRTSSEQIRRQISHRVEKTYNLGIA
jgi:hypothetical protein